MLLHTHPDEFRELITVVAADKHTPGSAVERDYYIVMMLKALADSSYADQCVIKTLQQGFAGTSFCVFLIFAILFF